MIQATNRSSVSVIEAKALDLLTRLMHDQFGGQVSDIILFGSKARDESTQQSDIDVLVILLNPSASDLKIAGGLGFDVWSETGVFLALQIFDEAEWKAAADGQSMFFRNVARDGISLLPSIV